MSEREDFEKYRGQWGGTIRVGSNGEATEEMWWTEPNQKIFKSSWSKALFYWDVRQHFILKFWKNWLTDRSKQAGIASDAALVVGDSLRVIDYGCGTGGTTLNFSKVMSQPILGVDVFETQLQVARHFSVQVGSNCLFERLGDLGQIPADDRSVDVVMSLDVLGHVPDIPKTLKEIHRVLKVGGGLLLFTEADFSPADHSVMARLAQRGANMVSVVPEHISMFSREVLEKMFSDAGFEVRQRYSANVWHFLFFPKDYVLLLKGREGFLGWYRVAWLWNRISKLFPFYPWPFQFLRLAATYLWGKKAFGTGYFYDLRKT